MTDDMPEAYRKLQTDFNAALELLDQALQSVRSSSKVIHFGSQEIAGVADDLSRRTEQQAGNLEHAAGARSITATVKKSADNANRAREVIAKTTGDAKKHRHRSQRGRRDGRDRKVIAADRANHQRHRRDREVNRPAHLTRPSRPPAPVKPAVASRSSRPRSAAWRSAPPPPPRRSTA